MAQAPASTEAAITSEPPPLVRPSEITPEIDAYFTALIERAKLKQFDEIMTTVNDLIYPLHQMIDQLSSRTSGAGSGSGNSLKVPLPNTFDGSREKGEAFLQSTIIYAELRPNDFATVANAITWILSFMNEGRALTWRNAAIAEYSSKKAYRWDTLAKFHKDFGLEFYPIGEAEDALATLEGRTYIQKASETVDAYVDRFRSLIKKAELNDQSSVVIKFRRGLHESIINTLADSPQPPAANNLDEWITRARNLERSRTLQRNISGPRQTLPPARPSLAPPFRGLGPSFTPRSVSTPAPSAPKPAPSGPTPMDLDALRRAREASVTCHRCKEVGHYANKCPRSFDIRFMTMDEIEEHRALAQDMEVLEERARQQEDISEETRQDFGSTSG